MDILRYKLKFFVLHICFNLKYNFLDKRKGTKYTAYANNLVSSQIKKHNRAQAVNFNLQLFKKMENIYQNNDIAPKQTHVDNIGRIIFSSKRGVIPTDFITKTKLNLIND